MIIKPFSCSKAERAPASCFEANEGKSSKVVRVIALKSASVKSSSRNGRGRASRDQRTKAKAIEILGTSAKLVVGSNLTAKDRVRPTLEREVWTSASSRKGRDSDFRNHRTSASAKAIEISGTTGVFGGIDVSAIAREVSSMDPVLRDCLALFATVVGSLVWMKLFDELARRNVLEAKLSRKLVHVTSGTFFAITWVLFGDAWYSKVFAAFVPGLQAMRLFAIGSGLIENKNAVRAVSREGGKEELLYGPFYYTIILILTTLLFWRDSPVVLLIISAMCGGDGVADIVGRRLGKNGSKWPKPFDEKKSFAGSFAMVIASFLFTITLVHLFTAFGFFAVDYGSSDDRAYYLLLFLICSSCAFIEALPASAVDDNISVATLAAFLGSIAFL
jgi:phytol kinase